MDCADSRRYPVIGKGNKRRYLYWDETTHILLAHWLSVKPQSDCLFCNKSGEPLQYDGLYQVIRRLAVRAGIKGKHNPHSIRHLYGKIKTAHGESAILLAQLMGHNDVNVTAKTYSHFGVTELEKIGRRKQHA